MDIKIGHKYGLYSTLFKYRNPIWLCLIMGLLRNGLFEEIVKILSMRLMSRIWPFGVFRNSPIYASGGSRLSFAAPAWNQAVQSAKSYYMGHIFYLLQHHHSLTTDDFFDQYRVSLFRKCLAGRDNLIVPLFLETRPNGQNFLQV